MSHYSKPMQFFLKGKNGCYGLQTQKVEFHQSFRQWSLVKEIYISTPLRKYLFHAAPLSVLFHIFICLTQVDRFRYWFHNFTLLWGVSQATLNSKGSDFRLLFKMKM